MWPMEIINGILEGLNQFLGQPKSICKVLLKPTWKLQATFVFSRIVFVPMCIPQKVPIQKSLSTCFLTLLRLLCKVAQICRIDWLLMVRDLNRLLDQCKQTEKIKKTSRFYDQQLWHPCISPCVSFCFWKAVRITPKIQKLLLSILYYFSLKRSQMNPKWKLPAHPIFFQGCKLESVMVIWKCWTNTSIIGKMLGRGPLGWGPLNNQPHIHLIFRGYLLGVSFLFRAPTGGLKQLGYHPRVTGIFPMIQTFRRWVIFGTKEDISRTPSPEPTARGAGYLFLGGNGRYLL